MSEHFITASNFAEKYKSNQLDHAAIIDVREPYEWEMYHLDKATLIPMNTVPEQMEQLPKDKPIYIVCAHGVRSWHVTNYLLQKGLSNVVNVEGGMAEVYLHFQQMDPKE